MCGMQADGVERDNEVVYVCDGSLTAHSKLKWSHAMNHVAILS
jgi:hypothetical protein